MNLSLVIDVHQSERFRRIAAMDARLLTSDTHIPRAAAVLGWLGVLPFAALSLLLVAGSIVPRATVLGALILYGALILSFMGGAQWGLAMTSAAGDRAAASRFAISVLPALAAFGLWFLPARLTLLGLAAAFLALLAYDVATARQGGAPAWYPALRTRLTAALVACLALSAWSAG